MPPSTAGSTAKSRIVLRANIFAPSEPFLTEEHFAALPAAQHACKLPKNIGPAFLWANISL